MVEKKNRNHSKSDWLVGKTLYGVIWRGYVFGLGVGIGFFLFRLLLDFSFNVAVDTDIDFERAVGFGAYVAGLVFTMLFIGCLLRTSEAKEQLPKRISHPHVFSDADVEETRAELELSRDSRWAFCVAAVAAFAFAEHWSGYFIDRMDINFYILILVVISVLLVGRFTLDYFSSSD